MFSDLTHAYNNNVLKDRNRQKAKNKNHNVKHKHRTIMFIQAVEKIFKYI